LLFVDTNILVYATRRSSSFHHVSRQALLNARQAGERLCVSRQVLREYLAVVTRPQPGVVPFTIEKALTRIELFARAMAMLEDGPTVTAELVALCRTVPLGGRQVHDANIVATLLAHGGRRLLTFNVGDFARFRPRIELVAP
jgi:predicted nucleic acid-binding protein